MRRTAPAALLLTTLAIQIAQPAHASISIRVTDPHADYFDDGANPCARGDADDDCSITSFIRTNRATNGVNGLFLNAWDAWNNSQPEGERWTLRHGPANVRGTIDITRFDTFNSCPGTSGVEVNATFTPGAGIPHQWVWVQAILSNYVPGEMPPHDAQPISSYYHMDVGSGPDDYEAPAYPDQEGNGPFQCTSQSFCLHNADVTFEAIATIVAVNDRTRTLTVYEGFRYGWDINCTHLAPSPGAAVALGIACMPALRRRR